MDIAISLLRRGGNDQSDVRRRLDSLTAQLDEHYFKLSEDAGTTTPEALFVFRKASFTKLYTKRLLHRLTKRMRCEQRTRLCGQNDANGSCAGTCQ